VQGRDLHNSRSQPREKKIGPAEAANLRPVWEVNSTAVEAGGSFTATPVIAGGCLYVGSTTGSVLALNADTGDLVWSAKLPQAINNSVTVDGDDVFAISGLRVARLDRRTGKVLWLSTFIDEQEGSETYGSPMVYRAPDGRRVVVAGVSGGGTETGDDTRRYKFQGNVVLLDGARGQILRQTYVIPRQQWAYGYAGGGVWSTPPIYPKGGYAYVGTGNPFQPEVQHERTNAIIKIDVNPQRRTFGKIVGHYTGTLDEYVEGFSDMPCVDVPGNPPPWYPQGAGACMDQDLDFGASPNLFPDADGNLLVGEGQKSGEYHVADATTMKRRHVTLLGAPVLVGGVVGNTAIDGDSVYGPITLGGYLWAVEQDGGALRWAVPTLDGVHYGLATTVANGVVYTVDLAGFLRAFDAASGRPLLAVPQSQTSPVAANLGGGVAVARNTVYGVTGSSVVAHRP
jgi:outer membrane protein assembly factor BamB